MKKRGRPRTDAVVAVKRTTTKSNYLLANCVCLLGAVFSDRGYRAYTQLREMLPAAKAADAATKKNFPGPASAGTGD